MVKIFGTGMYKYKVTGRGRLAGTRITLGYVKANNIHGARINAGRYYHEGRNVEVRVV